MTRRIFLAAVPASALGQTDLPRGDLHIIPRSLSTAGYYGLYRPPPKRNAYIDKIILKTSGHFKWQVCLSNFCCEPGDHGGEYPITQEISTSSDTYTAPVEFVLEAKLQYWLSIHVFDCRGTAAVTVFLVEYGDGKV